MSTVMATLARSKAKILAAPIFMMSVASTAVAGPQSFGDILRNTVRSTLQQAVNSSAFGTQRMNQTQSENNVRAAAAADAEIPELTKILWVYAPSAGYRFLSGACSGAGANSFVHLQAQSDYEQGNYFGAGTQYLQYAETVAECAVMPLGLSPPSARTVTPRQAYTIVGYALAKSFLADVKVTTGPLDAEDRIKATNAVKLLEADPASNAEMIQQIAATGVFGRPAVLPKIVSSMSGSGAAQ